MSGDKNSILKIESDLYTRFGFRKVIVQNVLKALLVGLGIKACNEKPMPIKQDESHAQNNIALCSKICKHTDISFFTGSEIYTILTKYFLHTEDGTTQIDELTHLLGYKMRKEIVDYFKTMGVIMWNSWKRSYETSEAKIKSFSQLHTDAYFNKIPSAIAKHLWKYKQIDLKSINVSIIQFYYKCSVDDAKSAFAFLPVYNPDIPSKFSVDTIRKIAVKLLHQRPFSDSVAHVRINEIHNIRSIFEQAGLIDNNDCLSKDYYIGGTAKILNQFFKTEQMLNIKDI